MVYSFCWRLKVSGEKLHGFLECPLYSLQITLWNVVAYYMATCERYSLTRDVLVVWLSLGILRTGGPDCTASIIWEIKEFHCGIYFNLLLFYFHFIRLVLLWYYSVGWLITAMSFKVHAISVYAVIL